MDWELPETNVKSMTALLTDKLNVDVIVFSNSDDVKSRAELASCGFEKTIQPPYNEKNFLMAVQKIRSDRVAENEKIERKLRHQERMTGVHEEASGVSAPNLHLVSEDENVPTSEDLHQHGQGEDAQGMQHFGGSAEPGSHEQFAGGPIQFAWIAGQGIWVQLQHWSSLSWRVPLS